MSQQGEPMKEQLCGCFSDFGGCIYHWCFPCCAMSSAHARLDGRNCECCDCLCGPPPILSTRRQLRKKFGLEMTLIPGMFSCPCEGTYYGDAWLPCLVPCIGIFYACQNDREIKARTTGANQNSFYGDGRVVSGGAYQQGMFGCFSDINSCLLLWCCFPCGVAYMNAHLNDRECDCCDLGSNYWFVRKSTKAKFGIPQDSCADCFLICCGFGPCMACQDYRELVSRKGQVAMGQPAAPMAQPMPPKM